MNAWEASFWMNSTGSMTRAQWVNCSRATANSCSDLPLS
jgi:hypothetical protein